MEFPLPFGDYSLQDSFTMSFVCNFLLILIGGGILIPIVSSEAQEIPKVSRNNVSDLIISHRKDIVDFFQTKTINFISWNNSQWMDIYDEMTREFSAEFSFNLFTDKFYSVNFRGKFESRFEEMEREGFVIDLNMKLNLVDAFKEIFRRNGFYLVVVNEGAVTDEEVLLRLRRIWKKIGSLSMITIFEEKLFRYNPFTLQPNGSYGALEPYQWTAHFKKELLSNMNGYPMIIEIFESGYNVGFYKEVNGTMEFDHFMGPDGVSVEIIRDKMNFTSEWRLNNCPN